MAACRARCGGGGLPTKNGKKVGEKRLASDAELGTTKNLKPLPKVNGKPVLSQGSQNTKLLKQKAQSSIQIPKPFPIRGWPSHILKINQNMSKAVTSG